MDNLNMVNRQVHEVGIYYLNDILIWKTIVCGDLTLWNGLHIF